MGRRGVVVAALEAASGARIRFVKGAEAGAAAAAGGDEAAGAVLIRGPPASRLRAWELLLAVRDALPPALEKVGCSIQADDGTSWITIVLRNVISTTMMVRASVY